MITTKEIHVFFPYFILFIIVIGCGRFEQKLDIEEQYYITLDKKVLNFTEKSSTDYVNIESNADYSTEISKDLATWCRIELSHNGKLMVSVSENSDSKIRKGEIYISYKNISDTIVITQLGTEKNLLLSKKEVVVDPLGEVFEIEVTSNFQYSVVVENSDWIQEVQEESTRTPMKDYKHKFKALINNNTTRYTRIIFSDTDNNTNVAPQFVWIKQSVIDDNYNPQVPDPNSIDTQITPNDVKTQYSGNASERLMLDEDISSYWEITTSKSTLPQWIEFTFNEPQNIDYILYNTKISNNPEGVFKTVSVEVYTEINHEGKAAYKEVYNGTLLNVIGEIRLDLREPQSGVTKVKITLHDSYDGKLCCSEMKFFKRDPLNFDSSELFEDRICTKLKAGVTLEQILACKSSFFKSLAWFIFNNKYETEFRIANFKPYLHPNTQAKEYKTSTYSLLDNPTGIYVEKYENLVIFADTKGVNDLAIRVQNLDKPGGDGFGGDEYIINNGINIMEMKNKGLVYVMYHTNDYANAPEITLHFASGKVNGYFDITKHKGRWSELLNKAQFKFFDVLGKYAHLNFPTERFKNHTKSGESLISLYDELVYNEQSLMGLAYEGKLFNNRMYLGVMYHSYMYATSYRTMYNENTLGPLCDETMVKANCWGPAHEIGHVNQTRPGFRWTGMTEVSNNVMSLYIQTSIWKQRSRLHRDNVYSRAWTQSFVKNVPHPVETNVFNKLVPFWQLQLYFGNVKGKTPEITKDKSGFYPTIYKYFRDNENKQTPGLQQLEFVYIASKSSGMNLIPFFKKWGLLHPVNTIVNDYGTAQFEVTQSDIDETIKRIESLNLPNCNEAIEYITDDNTQIFKEKRTIIKGNSSRIGNTIYINGWQNVVAYEIREDASNGTIVHIGEGDVQTITVTSGWRNKYKVYAVSYDSKRIELSL